MSDKARRRSWEECWETLEGLARDASRWHDNCGNNCGIDSLAEWRGRVLEQLHMALAEERREFERLSLKH